MSSLGPGLVCRCLVPTCPRVRRGAWRAPLCDPQDARLGQPVWAGEGQVLPHPHLETSRGCPAPGRALQPGGLAAPFPFEDFSHPSPSRGGWRTGLSPDDTRLAVESVRGLGAGSPSPGAPPPAPGVPAAIADERPLLGRRGVSLKPGGALSGVSGFGRAPHPVDHWESWEEPSKLQLSVFLLKRVIWYLNGRLETSEAGKNFRV